MSSETIPLKAATKICRSCGENLPVEMFPQNIDRRPKSPCITLRGSCKTCYNKQTHASKLNTGYYKRESYLTRQKNKDKKRARPRLLREKYGITEDDYDKMHDLQGGCCRICGTSHAQNRHGILFIDHCHLSNKIRGLLCSNCNTAIGLFKDNVDHLRSAIAYLTA